MNTYFIKSLSEMKVGDVLTGKSSALMLLIHDAVTGNYFDGKIDISDRKADGLFGTDFIYKVEVIDEENLEMLKNTLPQLREAGNDDEYARIEALISHPEVKIVEVVDENAVDKEIKEHAQLYIDGPSRIRMLAASRGFALDKFLYDDCFRVRVEAIKRKYGIKQPSDAEESCSGTSLELMDDILSQDEEIKIELAKQGCLHHFLMNDEDREVRVAVAETTKDENVLEVLVRDDSEHVKEAVARRKYGFPILLEKDEEGMYKNSGYVRAEVARNAQDDEAVKEELSKDKNKYVRIEIAKLGYAPCLNDANAEVRQAAYRAMYEKENNMIQ